MESEDKFWAIFWTLAATCLVTLIVSVSVYNMSSESKKLDAIKAGADPLEVRCSFDQTTSWCGVLAAKTEDKTAQ